METKPSVVRVAIPPGIAFADLKLTREADGRVSFDWSPIQHICEASGADVGVFVEAAEDNVAELIVAWYGVARANGEPVDATAEELIAEIRLEDERGDGTSHQPGRA